MGELEGIRHDTSRNIPVEGMIVHDQYNKEDHTNDIAIVLLTTSVEHAGMKLHTYI